jgi:hypothetical protein
VNLGSPLPASDFLSSVLQPAMTAGAATAPVTINFNDLRLSIGSF